MNIQFSLRKTTEAGLIVTALAALFLAGCGGGGGGGSSTTSTSTGGTGGSTAGNTTGISNAYITALTDGVGLRSFSLGITGLAQPVGAILTATASTGGSYSISTNNYVYTPTSWTASTTPTYYSLDSAGNWVASTTPFLVTPNADGTVTLDTADLGAAVSATAVAIDLSGSKLTTGTTYKLVNAAIPTGSAVVSVGAAPSMDSNGNWIAAASSVISPTATYPAGSTLWALTGVTSKLDAYSVYPTQAYYHNVKTPAGTLTSISLATANTFTTAAPLCYGNNNFQLVYSATQPVTANTARFDVYINNNKATCPAIAGGATSFGKVDLVFSTVRTQVLAEFTNYTTASVISDPFNHGSVAYPLPTILASVNGALCAGTKIPTGRVFDAESASRGSMGGNLNKTAMDAIMTAAGITKF